MNVISLGEVLWDVIGEQEHLGGAPFNFSAHLARLEHTVKFISAVGEDERGRRVLERMAQMGLSTSYVNRTPEYATGVVIVSIVSGQPQYKIERPAAYDFPQLTASQLEQLMSAPPNWIYFGTLQQMSLQARQLTRRVIDSARGAKCFYDVNLRQQSWTPKLIHELFSLATVVKLNDEEVSAVAQACGLPSPSLEEFCYAAVRKFHLESICVTRGVKGCAAWIAGAYLESPGYSVRIADTIGAGDAFAAAFLHGLGSGWAPARICDFANRVGAFVASRSGAIPEWTVTEVQTLQPTSGSSTIKP